MKTPTLLAIAITTSVVLFCSFALNDSDASGQNIKGNVKTLVEFRYEPVIQFDEMSRGKSLDSAITTFNERGSVTQFSHIGRQGENIYRANKSYRKAYKYNERNQRVEELRYNEYGKLELKRVLKYDSAGNRSEVNLYDAANVLLEKQKYKYNPAGQCTQLNRYRGNGDRVLREWYFYNSKGQRVKQAVVDGSNKLIEEIIYVYNSNGDTLQSTTYNSPVRSWTSQVSRIRNEYDASSRLITRRSYDSPWHSPDRPAFYDDNGRIVREEWEYTYDKNNNILTSKMLKAGVLTTEEVYKEGLLEKRTNYGSDGLPTILLFNIFGNLTSQIFNHSGGTQSVYEYVYDDSGRLIKSIETYFRDEHQYDEYNRLIQVKRYDKSNNQLSMTTEYSYYASAWKPHARTQKTYENGKVDYSGTKAILYEEDIAVDGFLWAREPGFLCTETMQFKWDQNNNVIEAKEIRAGSINTQTYSYTYDVKGNWTKKSHFKQPATTPDWITERIYEYFP
jgi:hypothetical protein